MVFAFVITLGAPAYSAAEAESAPPKVQLTDPQKQDLAARHQDILAQKKEVVAKYVEYGVISEEKGKKIISRMEQRYQKLEQNGFIPRWEKPQHKR